MTKHYRYAKQQDKIFIFKSEEYRDYWFAKNPGASKLPSQKVHHNMNMPRSEVRRRIYQAREDMASNNLKFIELTNTGVK